MCIVVVFLGDVHGNFITIRELDRNFSGNINAIIQVGDFGYNPRNEMWHKIDTPVYWIDGNHEWYDWLRPYMDHDGPIEVFPNLFYVPRGTVLEIDGKRIGCLGGAASVDAKWRQLGVNYFHDEILTESQAQPLFTAENLDYLVTHTPPKNMIDRHFNPASLQMFDLPTTWFDPSSIIVQRVREKHPLVPLICGHMHRSVFDPELNVRILDCDEAFPIN